MSYLSEMPTVQKLLHGADHFDEKVVEGNVSLHEFLAGCLTYYPFWIKAMYGIRAVFVRFLGMKQAYSAVPKLTPESISFTPGERATFFTVVEGTTESLWISEAIDDHLSANLIVAVESLSNGKNRFHVGTIVRYNKWTGPIYFNVIRPFHHIVVQSMMNAGARYQDPIHPNN